jgi:hypothetical protein
MPAGGNKLYTRNNSLHGNVCNNKIMVELINRLSDDVHRNVGVNPDERNWHKRRGVLISINEAKTILNLIYKDALRTQLGQIMNK